MITKRDFILRGSCFCVRYGYTTIVNSYIIGYTITVFWNNLRFNVTFLGRRFDAYGDELPLSPVRKLFMYVCVCSLYTCVYTPCTHVCIREPLTTADVTTADVLVLGYGLWVRVWPMLGYGKALGYRVELW